MAKYKITKILIASAALCIIGCTPAVQDASKADKAVKDEPPVTEAEMKESYRAAAKGDSHTFLDTLNRGKEISLAATDVPVLEVAAVVATPTASASGQGFTETTIDAPARFRIQILASSQIDMVRKEKLTAESVTSLPVTMSEEQSLYKLYVGDFKTKADAEKALPSVKKMGYSDAWIVTTK